MINTIRQNKTFRLISKTFNFRRIANLLLFLNGKSALHELGWFKSAALDASVDKNGNPIPWLTYGTIAILDSRIPPSAVVFEYGSGNSTLWWSKRVKHVYAVENNQDWYKFMNNKKPKNVTLKLRTVGEDDSYAKSIMEPKNKFNVVIIDGRERVKCSEYAVKKLAKDGVIIWDNTDREKYNSGYNKLIKKYKFKALDIKGLAPIDNIINTTTIFYKDGNCLNL